MANEVTDLLTVGAEQDSSRGPKVQRSRQDESPKPESVSNGQSPSVQSSPSTASPKGTEQGTPKFNAALERMKDKILSSTLIRLKTRLALDEKYCGAITLRGTSCRRLTPVKNKDAIVLSLRRLSSMTQSSEQLDEELMDLACLVHCHSHDRGSPSEQRVQMWTQTFPTKPSDRRSPVVIAREIRKALGSPTPICIGLTKAGERCKHRIGGQRVQNCGKSIAELVKVDDYWDRALRELFLSILEVNRYCHIHDSQGSMENVQRRLKDLSRIHEAAQPSFATSSASPSSTFIYPKHAAIIQARTASGLQGKIEELIKARRLLSITNRRNTLSWPVDSLVNFWPSEPDTTPLDVIHNADWDLNKEHLYPILCDLITAPLDPEDQKEGYIYAYQAIGSPGKVKIGYTTRRIEVRQEEWTYDCNRKAMLLYPTESDQIECVPNVRRIEALCHAELGQYRLRIYCHGCMKQHVEWFDAPAEKAIRVIREWTSWMKSKPYRRDLGGRKVLSCKWQETLVDKQGFVTQVST